MLPEDQAPEAVPEPVSDQVNPTNISSEPTGMPPAEEYEDTLPGEDPAAPKKRKGTIVGIPRPPEPEK